MNHPLQRAQREHAPELPRERPLDLALREEPQEGQQVDQAHEASEQPVDVLPPEDALEAVEVHGEVHQLVFGGRAVLGEQLLPMRFGKRRERADERLPLDDG